MARIPIRIEKIKKKDNLSWNDNNESVKYHECFQVKVENGNKHWNQTYIASREELIKLKEEIEELIASSTLADKLSITEEQAKRLEDFYQRDELCLKCEHQQTYNCITCVFTLQSPLERILYLEFQKSYLKVLPQIALNWQGQIIDNFTNTKFANLLTIPDFLLQKGKHNICIYADGYTYHERTEEQATRDRNIDRRLQDLGYKVFRYTGKEIRENPKRIVEEIKKTMRGLIK